LTPEAKEAGRGLLVSNHRRYIIDDAELDRVMVSYPLLWKSEDNRPELAFIGCPHLSLVQIELWREAFALALNQGGQGRLKLPTYLCTAPDVIAEFQKDVSAVSNLERSGAKLTPICPMMTMNNPLCRQQIVVTNSNKLRTYSNARFFLDDDLLEIVVSGKVPQGGRHG
jgi:predicted aconitase